MTAIGQNQRFASLLWLCVLVLAGSSLAQNPRRTRRVPYVPPSNSTADQEAQPNTANYPQKPVFTPYSQPRTGNYTEPVQPAAPTPAPPATPAQPTLVPVQQGFIGPPVPVAPTPEQLPPGAPKITYQNGLLSVESVNSRLSDILNAIHNRAGIQFEGLQPSPDRVAGKFGPAPANEVLATLLSGSRYDYVIMGFPDNPQLVQRVILTTNGSAGAVAAQPSAQIGNKPQAGDDEEENGNDDSEGQQEQSQAPAPQQLQPVQPVPQLGQNANNTPKTTEQLLEELKQMQQKNQQRQPPPAPIKTGVPQ